MDAVKKEDADLLNNANEISQENLVGDGNDYDELD